MTIKTYGEVSSKYKKCTHCMNFYDGIGIRFEGFDWLI